MTTHGPGDRVDLAYIVPRLTIDDASHFSHLPALLGALATRRRVAVIAERADDGIAITGVEMFVQRRADGNRLARMMELATIARRLKRRGCHVFFVRISVTAGLALGLACPLIGARLYYWTSGQPRRTLPGWTSRPWRRLMGEAGLLPFRAVLALAHRVVTGPERMVDVYEQDFGVRRSKMLVLYNDVDLERFGRAQTGDAASVRRAYGLPADGPLALYVHRLTRKRGCFDLIDAVERARTEVPDLCCLIVGDGPDLGALRQQVADRGLGAVVAVPGPIPNSELPDVYAAADLKVMPSHSEGLPRVLLEAMAAGLPIVATDVGGVADVLGDRQQAFIVPPGDVASLARLIVTLVRDPALRSALAAENRERVRRYSTPAVADMFVERVLET